MHYIIGTSFTVERKSTSAGVHGKISSTTPVQSRSQYELLFEPGFIYQLYRIAKDGDMFVYYFNRSDGTKHEIKFPSCREADTVIAKFRKEQLPDYETVYRLRA